MILLVITTNWIDPMIRIIGLIRTGVRQNYVNKKIAAEGIAEIFLSDFDYQILILG